MKDKPTVHYTELCGPPTIGFSAYVVTSDHPSPLVTPGRLVETSPVQSLQATPDGKFEFETLNTRYVPA